MARKLVANFGDVNPLTYGGSFVFENDGEYTCEHFDVGEEGENVTVYRFNLPMCTFINGVLSDNEFHPNYPAWFADSIGKVAECCGVPRRELVDGLCASDPVKRAAVFQDIGRYHGFDNLDSYPITLTESELAARYLEWF